MLKKDRLAQQAVAGQRKLNEQQQRVIGRENPQCPVGKKPPELCGVLAVLKKAQQLAANQKAAEDKKEIDTDPPGGCQISARLQERAPRVARQKRRPWQGLQGVPAEDQRDGQGTQGIQCEIALAGSAGGEQ